MAGMTDSDDLIKKSRDLRRKAAELIKRSQSEAADARAKVRAIEALPTQSADGPQDSPSPPAPEK